MARVDLQEFQRAVLHSSGLPVRVLGPGRHRFRRRRSVLAVVDLRPALLKVAGQEVLTADGLGVRASVVVRYSVTDPLRWVLAGDSETSAVQWLYLAAQLAVRDFIGGVSAEDLLATRSSAAEVVTPRVRDAAERIGAVVEAVDLRDVSFPGDLRRTFALVVVARQEALASLERARGEVATLRSLANAARALEGNPALRELRSVLAVERTSGTVVLNVATPEGTSAPSA
ncbi:slipin family protein [Pengzhenrongella sicca]|uniref:Slipin family protein n=1 Tax=Pengzhenrongella sicca TaxID=2819238 RepID=A0A8A4ZIX9_9MICO|nr:slipin family protein [Pengzhenrongella sicca]QTE30467.1 slipin family protein [Pengzhenrongella sicca]